MDTKRQDLPRIEVDFPAAVLLEGGALIHVAGVDISRGGMGLGCDRATARSMVLRASLVSPDAGAEFDIEWQLPDSDPTSTPRSASPAGPSVELEVDSRSNGTQLRARARLAWSKPDRAQGHRLGLSFLDFVGDSQSRLAAFIESAMR